MASNSWNKDGLKLFLQNQMASNYSWKQKCGVDYSCNTKWRQTILCRNQMASNSSAMNKAFASFPTVAFSSFHCSHLYSIWRAASVLDLSPVGIDQAATSWTSAGYQHLQLQPRFLDTTSMSSENPLRAKDMPQVPCQAPPSCFGFSCVFIRTCVTSACMKALHTVC